MGRTCKVLTQVLDGNLAEVDGLRYRFAGSSVSATKYDFDMCDFVYCFLNLMNPYVLLLNKQTTVHYYPLVI